MARVQVFQASELSGRGPLADLIVGVLDQLPAHMLVGVVDVDVPRSGVVRNRGDHPREWCVLDEAADVEILSAAEVETDADGQLRVAPEEVLGRHRAIVGCV